MKFWEMEREGLIDSDGEWIGNEEHDYPSMEDIEKKWSTKEEREEISAETDGLW